MSNIPKVPKEFPAQFNDDAQMWRGWLYDSIINLGEVYEKMSLVLQAHGGLLESHSRGLEECQAKEHANTFLLQGIKNDLIQKSDESHAKLIEEMREIFKPVSDPYRELLNATTRMQELKIQREMSGVIINNEDDLDKQTREKVDWRNFIRDYKLIIGAIVVTISLISAMIGYFIIAVQHVPKP